ncbi:MAG: glycosyltransferase family 39 protein [Patescibacteria group bacterium]
MPATLKMIAGQTLRPDFPSFYHMAIPAYIYLPFFLIFLVFLRLSGLFGSLGELETFGLINYDKLLPLARFISVILGAISIYILYKICLKLFKDKFVALTASFLLATSLMFVQLSHFGRVWLPQVFTILVAFFCIIGLYEKPLLRIKDYLWAALFIGISFGTHFVGLLVYFPFLVIHYFRNRGRKLTDIFLKNRNFLLSNFLLIIIAIFIYFLNPYGFINYGGRAINAFSNLGDTVSAEGGESFLAKITYHGKTLLDHEPILIILFIPSLFLLWLKKRNIFFILSSFIFGYYLIISFAIGGAPRFILPVIPFIAMVVAYGLNYFYKSEIFTRQIKIAILVLILSSLLYAPLLWDYKLIQPSTRILAKGWIYKSLSEDTKIINLDSYFSLNENRKTIEDLKRYNSADVTKKRNFLLSLDETEYPRPNYYIFEAAGFENIPEEISDKDFDYIVMSWWNNDDYKIWHKKISSLIGDKKVELIKRFPKDAAENSFIIDLANNMIKPYYFLPKLKQNGPVVDIYRID